MRLTLVYLLTVLALTAQYPAALMRDATVKAALVAAKVNELHFIEEQIRVCEIPARPFMEEKRAVEMEKIFKQLSAERPSCLRHVSAKGFDCPLLTAILFTLY
jgi:hypothetical protein